MLVMMHPLLELPAMLDELVAVMPATARSAGGGFALVEHAWHLYDIETEAFQIRIARLLAERSPQLPDVDGGHLARTRDYLARDIHDGVARFARARTATIARLARLDAFDRRRTGILEGVGTIELGELPARILLHDRSHAAELAALAREHGVGDPVVARLAAFGRTPRSPCGPRAGYPPRVRWLARAREVIADGVVAGSIPTLAQAAARLGTSARSLQRRLHERGLAFRCLIEEIRQQLAAVGLERGIDASELGSQLGYADRRTLVRALQRWGISAAWRSRSSPPTRSPSD